MQKINKKGPKKMEGILTKELLIKLLMNNFKYIDLKDIQKNLKLSFIKQDDEYKIEISKQIKLKEEEFIKIEKEIEKIFREIEDTPEHWENSNLEYPDLKKIWEFCYQDNEKNYKKEGTITYPENWIQFVNEITKRYI